ncbi:MAG TPA: ribonuclease HI family protein [Thermoanaerobaculia bacterium]|nr:ribonuclease HI family protein [Thermoanaerobaculia bacterium]HXT51915.1 ribonuclease HI family protein [Thermoanaerobaculia bacterium]
MKAARAWFDGAARGNPGEAGFGLVVESDGTVEELGGYLGRTTNNVAEYSGLLAALTWARRAGVEELSLFGDSELVLKQLSGVYKVKAPHLMPLFLRALALRREIPRVRIQHVPRKENARADKLSNRAIDERLPVPEWLQPALG